MHVGRPATTADIPEVAGSTDSANSANSANSASTRLRAQRYKHGGGDTSCEGGGLTASTHARDGDWDGEWCKRKVTSLPVTRPVALSMSKAYNPLGTPQCAWHPAASVAWMRVGVRCSNRQQDVLTEEAGNCTPPSGPESLARTAGTRAMRTACALPAYCLYTVCALPVHCMCTDVHCLRTACTLPAHCLCTARALPAYCLRTACALPAHYLCTICALPAHTLCALLAHCLRAPYVHCLRTACAPYVHCLRTVCALYVHHRVGTRGRRQWYRRSFTCTASSDGGVHRRRR